MDDPNTPSYRSWSPSKHRRVDRACAQFEADLKAGKSPKIEDFLLLVPEVDRPALKRELLAIEAELAAAEAPGSSQEKQSLTETAASQPGESESPKPASDCPARPGQIGRYRIVRTLGEGGFGTVYLAHDEELKRPVAVKVPQKHRISSPKDVERYIAEARVVASLDHSGIVPVYDVGRTNDELCYVVSKFIEGSDLRKRTRQSRPSHHESAGLVAKVAEALHYRLPTEAEWEYACRAGSVTEYASGDDESFLSRYAVFRRGKTEPGGNKMCNGWGLFDTHGNVYEWCQDWYATYGIAFAVTDPAGPALGDERVQRGGMFFNQADLTSSAYRHTHMPYPRLYCFGFRLARTCP